jgi:ketosteroid isomerase-like protein
VTTSDVRHSELRLTAFRSALHEHLSALQAKNVHRFAATLGRDVTVVDGRGGVLGGTAAVLESHAAWFAASDPWSFDYDIVMLRELAGAGLALLDVTYRERPSATPARFLLSLVFERNSDGAWKFVYDQNTSLSTPPLSP